MLLQFFRYIAFCVVLFIFSDKMISLKALCSQNSRMLGCGLEGTSVGHPVQPSCRRRVTQSRLHKTLSRRVLNISREGDSTTTLGSLCQGSVTL